VEESRLGLLINGLLKVPMQFFILFVGAMVFVFYQLVAPPVLFNPAPLTRLRRGPHANELAAVETRHRAAFEARRAAAESFVTTSSASKTAGDALAAADAAYASVRAEAVALVKAHDVPADASDTNYVFLSFVLAHLPAGLVGLILAVVFAASMSSNSAALNSLASTSVVDVYVRLVRKSREDAHYLAISRVATALWGAFSIAVAMYANRVGTLIEAVNILGSLFYGTMLGIFLLAFYVPNVRGTPAFAGGLAGLAAVWTCFAFTKLSYLWFNVVGCVVVIGVALALNAFPTSSTPRSSSAAP
jgi:solute:Na+ symporter, SSS family